MSPFCVRRGKGRTLLKPYGAAELLEACRKIVSENTSMQSLPSSVRANFSFDPSLLSGGSQAADGTTEMYADADDYMKAGAGGEDEDIGSSSLSQELKQLGVAQSKKKSDARAARREQLKAIRAQFHADSIAEEDAEEAEAVEEDAASDLDEDAADEMAVEANERQFSKVLGVLEDDDKDNGSAAARQHENFITLGAIGQPNAGKCQCAADSSHVTRSRVLMRRRLNCSAFLCSQPP